MTRSIPFSLAAAAAMVLAAAACNSDSTSPSPDSVSAQQEASDIGVAAADATGDDVDFLYVSVPSAIGSAEVATPPGGAAAAGIASWSLGGPCPYDAGTGRHVCPTVTNGQGLSLDRSYAFFMGTTPQEFFNASSTTSINFLRHVFGTVTMMNWNATVDRSRDLTVTPGSNGAWNFQRLWNGTGQGTETAQNTDGSVSRTYSLQTATTITDVLVGVPRAQNPWPLSGTITHDFTGTRTRVGAKTVTKTVSYVATITFNGQSIVPLDVGTRQFCLDLLTRRLVNVNCR
ncbi:MAG TPA: hypothetical protein VEI06_08470 [Gemmatimonadaceae bacterium]|nr:hypothetical protein [Gemmatimonadaceae bacterium]